MSDRIRLSTEERFVDSPRGGMTRQVVVVITLDGHRYIGYPEPDDMHARRRVLDHAKLLRLEPGG